MRVARMLRQAPLWALVWATAAVGQTKIVWTEPVILRDGTGAARFTLTNTGKTALPLSLSAGSFTDDTSHASVGAPKVTFGLEAGGGKIPPQIEPGQSLQFAATVSDLAGTSAADAKVFNGDTEVGNANGGGGRYSAEYHAGWEWDGRKATSVLLWPVGGDRAQKWKQGVPDPRLAIPD